MERKKFDLEDRLIKFACGNLTVCEMLPASKAAQNLEYQLARSSTAAALIYGEAQAAESTADFVHKMKLVLKEIRETRVNLRIISEKPVIVNPYVIKMLEETNQLLAIFIKSIATARKNNQRQ